MTLDGMSIEQVAAHWGVPRHTARHRASRYGYRLTGQILTRNPSVYDVEDEITARLAVNPPSAPCMRCGARICDHRRTAA